MATAIFQNVTVTSLLNAPTIDVSSLTFKIGGVTKGQLSTTMAWTLPNTITGSSDAVQFKILGNSTQTSDVFQVLASDGTTVRLAQDTKGYLKTSNSAGRTIWISTVAGGVPANATGPDNTIIGDSAGKALTTGASNTILGSFAGVNTTGTGSTLIGFRAGYTASSGGYNVFIGQGSGNAVTTGGNNIFLGYNSGVRQTTNSNLLIIDNQDRTSAALEATSALLYGVFNATPASQTLTINGALTVAHATGLFTITGGLLSLSRADGTDVGMSYTSTAYSAYSFLDESAGNLYIGSQNLNTFAPTLGINIGVVSPRIGFIGIGTTAPLTKLHVISSTEQLRLGYDSSNYKSETVGSTGSVTTALTGTTPVNIFSQVIRGNGGFQSSDGSAGATGSFTTVDLKTVTVKNGLITAIV